MRGLWIEHAIVCALLGLVVYSQVCILNGEKRVSDMQIETSKVMRALVLGEVDTLHAVRRAAGAEKLTKAWAPFPPPQHPQAVDCNDVPIATPIRAFGMASLGPKYMVSYSWWDLRGSPHQKTYEQMRTVGGQRLGGARAEADSRESARGRVPRRGCERGVHDLFCPRDGEARVRV